MKITQEDFVRSKATEWFRTLERQLIARSRLETRTGLAMISLEAESNTTFPRSALTYHGKYRDGKSLPNAIHRVRLCGAPAALERPTPAGDKPFNRWYQHRKGPPSHDELFLDAKDVGLLDLYNAFEDRKDCLNAARNELVTAGMSIAARVRPRADPRHWEAGELSEPPPLLLSNELPATDIKALGGAWRIFLRMAAVLDELHALAARHNAHPPCKDLWLAFRIDREHPHGSFIWTLRGRKLTILARAVARGGYRGRIDGASLPDRLMRILKISAADRKAIRPHELHRRRMARIYEKYVEFLKGLLKVCPKRIASALDLLRRAGVPESELTGLASDPFPLAM